MTITLGNSPCLVLGRRLLLQPVLWVQAGLVSHRLLEAVDTLDTVVVVYCRLVRSSQSELPEALSSETLKRCKVTLLQSYLQITQRQE